MTQWHLSQISQGKMSKQILGQNLQNSSSQKCKSEVFGPKQFVHAQKVSKAKDEENQAKIQDRSNYENEQDWKPVKLENTMKKFGMKIQENENNKKLQRKRLLRQQSLKSPHKVNGVLKRIAIEYHKSLMEQTLQRQKMEQELGVKHQQEWIQIDKNLRHFPLDNQQLKKANFASMDQLITFLEKQEQQLLKQIGDDLLKSVFCESFQIIVKKTLAQKEFQNLKCKVSGCNAILKCIFEKQKQKFQIYLLRNKHSHTITGFILESQAKVHNQIFLDHSLHQIFGFNKGVRSQTRNLKYFDPQQRRIRVAQLRRQRKLARLKEKNRKQIQNPIQAEQQAKICKEQQKKPKIKQKILDQSVFLRNKRQKQQLKQFNNMRSELIKLWGLTIIDLEEKIQSKFIDSCLLTNQDLLSKARTTTLRYIVSQSLIRIDKNRENPHNNWSIILITALNAALKPIIVGLGLSSRPISPQIRTFFDCFFKRSQTPHYLISEYTPLLLLQMKQLLISQNHKLKILLDSNDILMQLKKELKNQQHQNVLRELLNPINHYQQLSFKKYFVRRQQDALLAAYQQFRQFVIIRPSEESQFYGFQVDISLQKQLICKLKQKLKHLNGRYSLKYQFSKVLQFIFSTNKHNQDFLKNPQILQIQKIHHDKHLLPLRKSITPYVLNQFYLQYGQALALQLKQGLIPNQYSFQRGKVTYENQKCSCGFYGITGIPCRHMIRVLKAQQTSYLAYFDKKWLVPFFDQARKEQRSRTRQKKKSRRNRVDYPKQLRQ